MSNPSRMVRRLIVSLLLVSLLSPDYVARADTHPRTLEVGDLWVPSGDTPKADRTFQQVFRRAQVRAEDSAFDFYYTVRVGDLDLDGHEDVLAHHWQLSPADTGAGYSGVLELTALSGGEGRRLWSVRRKMENSLPVPAQGARVGSQGRPGAVLFMDSHFPTFSRVAIGITGSGRVEWEQTFESTYSYQTPFAATNLPTGFYFFDALEGAATDILVGRLDYADSVAELRVTVVDGRDGSVMEREPVEIGVGAYPTVIAVNDLDRDRKDDYVVASFRPDDGGHVSAFSGAVGTLLWGPSYVDVATPNISMQDVGPLTADGLHEIAVSAPSEDGEDRFHVLDGRTGESTWIGRGTFPYLLGDTNGDGSKELGVSSVWQSGDRMGEEFRAYSSSGSLRYNRRYSVNARACVEPCSVLSYLLDAGDLDDDGVEDLFVQRFLDDGTGVKESSYLVRGHDGSKHLRSVKAVPVMGSFDGEGDDVVRILRRSHSTVVSGYDGRGGRHLWSTSVRGVVMGPLSAYGSAASFNGDNRADLFVTLERKAGAWVVALDGRYGSILWSREIRQ